MAAETTSKVDETNATTTTFDLRVADPIGLDVLIGKNPNNIFSVRHMFSPPPVIYCAVLDRPESVEYFGLFGTLLSGKDINIIYSSMAYTFDRDCDNMAFIYNLFQRWDHHTESNTDFVLPVFRWQVNYQTGQRIFNHSLTEGYPYQVMAEDFIKHGLVGVPLPENRFWANSLIGAFLVQEIGDNMNEDLRLRIESHAEKTAI